MRGKALRPHTSRMLHRITPAYAGKSHAPVMQHPVKRDHPRVCGEKCMALFKNWLVLGSPPRMRGKVGNAVCGHALAGITPAYAGKRCERCDHRAAHQDHPRVCGEKLVSAIVYYTQLGSPPRMRGKGCILAGGVGAQGITPAYAGKSTPRRCRLYGQRDHPRVCGEKTKKIP